MRKIYCFLLSVITIASSFNAKAQINHLVISQVYGGGGNSGAPYSNDFVELFNPTASTISLSGMSIQYASSAGTSWTNKLNLTGSLEPGKYFLIQLATNNAAVGSPLPTPDLTGTINMSGTSGKVALVNSTTAITGSGCPIVAPIIDFAGYGSADCSEGSSAVAALTNTTAAIRKNNGCTDTDINSSDFTTGAPNPRNSASPANICGTPSPGISVSPTSLSGFTTTAGTASSSQSFSVSGSNLTANIMVTPTSSFEVSTDNSNFSSSLTLSQSSGTVNSTTVYVRISASAPAGTANGIITLSSSGATDKTVSVSGTVNAITSVDPPQSFLASAVSTSEIDLTATGNASGDNIVVAYNITSTFGTPSGSLSAGNSISGGGTVLYSGPSAGFSFQHTGLTPSTTYYYSIWSVDASNNYSTSITANATTNAPPNPHVVINQVYGGGGNSGATYKNDFIELYNNENFAVSLNGMSVQYASAGGNFGATTVLSGTIPAHGFYLIQEAAGTNGTVNLPTPDATGSIAMSGTSGKVALVNGTTALGVVCPSTPNVIDLVGYGTTTCYEGSGSTDVLTNTTAAIRKVDGADTNDNAGDFETASPNPRNSAYTVTAPVIVSLNPADNSLNVPYSNATTIVFDKAIQKGTGNITVYENGVALPEIDVNSSAITISGNSVNLAINYAPAKSYYILIDAGAFKDVYGNNFAGITNPDTWNFTTILVTPPVTFDFQKCTGSGLLPDGFSQFSETGSIVWDCTPFGRDPNNPSGTAQYPNAVQINGFANGTNVPNVDWLISPSIDLTSTTYPLLSFWSRTAFNGLPLQLKVSTDYVNGDPRLATWTDINGKLPQQTSNIWTLSENINLSAFKSSNVHFAFVYTSTNEDGARWTVDDISVINSATPPPPSLTVGISDIQFGYVANGSTGDKSFSFTGNDLTDGVTVNSGGAFLVSKDGSNFSSSINYNVDEVNNIPTTVYVRFTPIAEGQNFTGTVTVSTSSLLNTINLAGTSIDPATTLEVVNWNMEWFGSTSLGPTNDDQQEQNAEKILKNIGADIFGLVEVVDESRLARIVGHMPGYSYLICNYGSHTNPYESGAGPLSEAQKEAFVYKTDLFSNISTIPLVTNGVNTAADLSNPAYNYFSSGRYPFMMTADVNLNGITKTVRFVLLHAKANTSPTATSYARRKAGADTLKYTLNTNYPNDNILMLGDFNDDLDSTITDGIHPRITSYYSFTNDTVTTFSSPTLALSLAGKKSTVSYNDMIDHVMLSNEMQPWYMQGSATVLSDVSSLVSNYGSTTTDHYPVFTRYMFCKITPPADTTVSNDSGECGAVVNFNVSSAMTCGTVTAVPASGSFFSVGITTVKLTASTGDTASFTVTVTDDEMPTIIPSGTINATVDAGKCYSENISLGVPQTNDNCAVQSVTNDAPAQFPVGTTTVTWTVTDIHENTETATQTVIVADDQKPLINCPVVPVLCYNANGNYIIPEITATDNCGISGYSYVITGATNRTGSSSNASGTFNIGVSTIIWTVTDIHGNSETCQTTVTVNSPVTSNVPDVYAVSPGGSANTIYIGYGPSSVTLNASVSGGAGGYMYKWTIGSSAGPALNSTSSYSVSPASTTTYYLNVKDMHGCSAPVTTKTISVVDVRCGPKLDKVTVCTVAKGKPATSCLAQKDVADALSAGSMLGSCINAPSTAKTDHGFTLMVNGMPNPSTNYFTITVQGGNVSEKVILQITDVFGRVIEQKSNLQTNSTIQIGSRYRPGMYLAEIIQGSVHKQLKLVKL